MVVELRAVAFGGTDEAVSLVRQAAAGDDAAFDELVRRHWQELVRLARVVLASDLEAEDLVQETLVHAGRRLGGLREPASFLPWLRRSLIRRGVRLLRRRRRLLAQLAAAGGPPAAAPVETPHAAVQVESLLAALTPRQRATVFLVEVEGFTTAEAARRLGASEATLRVHLFLASRRLRAKVERSLGEAFDEAALAAVRQWRFEPVQQDGKPVEVELNITINFVPGDAGTGS